MAFSLQTDARIKSLKDVDYRVIQWLGKGGNSHVYLATTTSEKFYGVPFAIKVFLNIEKQERLEKFNMEMDFLKNCDHPSAMKVYDNGIINFDKHNYPFVVAEYLPDTLKNVILTHRATMVERVTFTLQLLSILAYLNRQDPQVIHRDIKPENIFLKAKSCVLGDFGLMKFLDGTGEDDDREFYKESTGPGMPKFYRTPDLVSYARGEKQLTIKSDIFQLGLVLAELFTSKNPLVPITKPEDMLNDVELKPIGYIPGLRDRAYKIKTLIDGMLEIDPDNRPLVEELLDEWDGIFRELVMVCTDLDGKTF